MGVSYANFNMEFVVSIFIFPHVIRTDHIANTSLTTNKIHENDAKFIFMSCWHSNITI